MTAWLLYMSFSYSRRSVGCAAADLEQSLHQYRKFDNEHFVSIEKLLVQHQSALAGYRHRTIDKLNRAERATISTLFQGFERVLGETYKGGMLTLADAVNVARYALKR